MKKTHIRHVASSTVSKHFSKYLGIRWHTSREEQLRQTADMSERLHICSQCEDLPDDYFTDRTDGTMDDNEARNPDNPKG